MQLFQSQSMPLYNFFNNPWTYYIPSYQRQYSWDTDNVTKLMDDLYDGVRRIVNTPDYLRFIGAVILLEVGDPITHIHYDYQGLLSNIFNVIDGQQRISTIAVIGCKLHEALATQIKQFEDKWTSISTCEQLMASMKNAQFELQELYSFEVKKAFVDPARKPIIIRSLNQKINPVIDQWTLKDDFREFYKSDIASLIATYISEKAIDPTELSNSKLKDNIKEIQKWIERTMDSKDFPSAECLLAQQTKGLKDFADSTIDLQKIKDESSECYDVACGCIKLLAFIKFLTHRTYLTYIQCPSENLAFDMFQSLNATGTPLTAIEVFKPLVVNTYEGNYDRSKAKDYFDEVDTFFDNYKNTADKESNTNEILLRLAMIHNSVELSRRFSDQRDWLFTEFNECNSEENREDFIKWIANICKYWANVYSKRKPRRNSSSFNLVRHLVQLGMSPGNADDTALRMFFLKDAGHSMAHYLLALFYGKLLRAQTDDEKKRAADELRKVARACAAFYIYWRGTVSGFPDDVYRDLFSQDRYNLSNKSGIENQNSSFVLKHFRDELHKKGVFDKDSEANSRNLWLERSTTRLEYGRQTVCRFALFLAFHDMAPDLTEGHEGEMCPGREGSATFLTCQKWYSEEYEILEHIANRDKVQPPYRYEPAPSEDVYPGDYSVVDRIGNLTLWSRSANSSTYPEWPDKCLYYASLTRLTPTEPVDIDRLKAELNVQETPPSLESIVNDAPYLSHLAPLVLKGLSGGHWDKAAIDQRSKNICNNLYAMLMKWLSE